MGQLNGKICLVTGASRGIGAAAAQGLAHEGSIVYAAARRTDATAVWVEEAGFVGRIIPIKLDVTNTEEIKQQLLSIRRKHGRLDVLVNNAAIERNERIGMISRKSMQEMFETNVFGPIELLQIVARMMKRTGGGSIINIASRVGERGGAGQLVYSATKGAVIAFTYSAAKELASSGIRVNAIAPGLTDTEMFQNVPEEQIRTRLGNICMGRLAQPEEIADAIVFLASDRSSFISGHVLNVDGCTII